MTNPAVPFSNARIVNTITAGPLLNLMLALEGMEAPGEPDATWEVFKRFAQVPSQSVHDVVGFQVVWIQVEGGDPFLSCSWVRQLTDDAAGYDELTRAIQVEYAYSSGLLNVPDPVEIWSDEYGSLAEFFEAVEAQPQFAFLLQTSATFTGVYVRDQEDIDELD